DPGVRPLGGTAPRIRATPGLSRVVVALGGLGVHLWRDGGRLLDTARRGILGRGEHLGAVVGKSQLGGAQRAADLV
ncbi:MAG: hypothetical protein ACYCV1_13520, partial [Acidimicrobiales bacterium]